MAIEGPVHGPVGALNRASARRLYLLSLLGNPQDACPVVSVAGTNGKGSTAAMLAEVLHQAGHRVARYTSPDLNGPHERFWLSGQLILPGELTAREAALAPILTEAEAAFPDLPPMGQFERWTAIFWLWLRESDAHIAVVEAGIGGLTDATNVVSHPLLTLISTISLEHEARLAPALLGAAAGNSVRPGITAIAAHKAGLLRPGVPLATAATGEALAELQRQAALVGCPVTVVSPLSHSVAAPLGDDPAPLVQTPDGPARLALAGAHQRENAALAYAGVALLRQAGWTIPIDAVLKGFAQTRWPGRLETLTTASGTWLLDGAHNPQAIATLVKNWGHPAIVVAGFRSDKAAGPMVAMLTAGCRPLVLTAVPGISSASYQALAPFANGPLFDEPDLDRAFALARQQAPASDSLCVVTGSLWLVGAARARLLESPHQTPSGGIPGWPDPSIPVQANCRFPGVA